MRRLPVLLLTLLSACTQYGSVTDMLIVGRGPCDDTIGTTRTGGQFQIVHGCVGVPLIEATRSATAPYDVEGRVLLAGSLEPWPGANVIVEGRHIGTATDERGRFTLGGLGADERIVVTAIGMWPDTLVVGRLLGPRVPRSDR